MATPALRRNNVDQEEELIDVGKVAGEAKTMFSRFLGDVGKYPATKQLVIGGVSGWCTGFITMKVGKVAALGVGAGIIILQIANHHGYININWNKVCKQVDKVSEKVEEAATGQGPQWKNKMERYVDRKLDKAEDVLKHTGRKARRWYHKLTGEDQYHLKEIHIFLAAFTGGLALGIVSGQ